MTTRRARRASVPLSATPFTAIALAELGEPRRATVLSLPRSLSAPRTAVLLRRSPPRTTKSDESTGAFSDGKVGDPSSNFAYVEPGTPSQPGYRYDADQVYVVPNPASTESMAAWALSPNNDDPTGIKVEFRNLPATAGTIRIYTLAGDLVQELRFDGRLGEGTLKWDLVSRNAQDVTSGVYLYAIETSESSVYKGKIGKFVVIR